MSPLAPGVYTTVTAAPPSPNNNQSTGTWFVTGQTGQGPTGVAIPITSMTDYANYLGSRVTYGYLYDALDEFFHDGGVLAYVSRLVGPSASAAAVSVNDTGGSPQATLQFSALGAGIWGNNLQVVISAGSASNSYAMQVTNNGTVIATSPNCFTPADAVNWFAAQASWVVCVKVTNLGSTNSNPTNNPATGTYSLTGGTDDTADVSETQWTNALNAFLPPTNYGPGQVSAPGHTTQAGYIQLANHAYNNNRVALLDAADSSSASNLISQATSLQTQVIDPSYAALFAPWVVIPGIISTNPGQTSPLPQRTVPPSALVAAQIATSDQVNTANVPAAGNNGTSSYALGVTNQYVPSDLGSLNASGVDVIRPINGQVTVYGYNSLALDPRWIFFNNVRFRMQMIFDFDFIGEGFVFAQIDGQGQLFARFNASLSGKCLQYYKAGSLYGSIPADAFTVNTGPQVNTPASINAGQLNALVLCRMSPYAEYVQINVIKYAVNQSLPASVPVSQS